MARRVGSESPFEIALREPLLVDVEWPSRLEESLSPKTAARFRRIAMCLARLEDGLSFNELRAISGTPTLDLRSDLELAIRAGVVRRVGARNTLRYLYNSGPIASGSGSSP